MESGRLYRLAVTYFTQIGVIALATAALIIVLHLLFPGLGLLTAAGGVIELVVLLVIGLLGVVVGLTHFIWIVRERRAKWREIMERVERERPAIEVDAHRQAPYLLADSVDREVLSALREIGGHVLDLEERLWKRGIVPPGNEFYRRVSKLILLGLLAPERDEVRLYLTSAGMDALNTPAALFITNLPETVWNHVFQAKTSLWQEQWANVVVETSKAFEAAMKRLLESVVAERPDEWEAIRKRFGSKGIDRLTAGQLLGALRAFGVVDRNSFEDYLAGELVKLRNRVHAKDVPSFGPAEAERCDIYSSLLLRSWFGVR